MAPRKYKDLTIYRRIFHLARPYRPRLTVLLGLNLLAAPLLLLNPVPLKIAVDSVLGAKPLPDFLAPMLPAGLSESAILWLAVGLVILVALLHKLQALLVWVERMMLSSGTPGSRSGYHKRTGPKPRVRSEETFVGGVMRLSFGINLAVALTTAAVLISCEADKVEQLPTPVRPVRFQQVYATGGMRTRTFTGVAKAGIESRISFKVPGTIEILRPKVGDLVREGGLIAELDPRDYELLVEEAEASLAQARAMAVKAEADFGRVRGLFERDNASQGEYDGARAARNSARAQVRAIEKRLESAKLRLSYTRLESPIDGAAAAVPVEVNENVQAGQPIVVLNSGIRPEVEVAIPEILIGEIRKGASVTVTFDATGERSFGGAVTEVGVSSTPGLTTYPVTVSLSRASKDIRPGMAAETAFRFGSGDDRVRFILPPHAVVEDREGNFVYVVKGEGEGLGTVERRSVLVGELVGAGLEVLEGLSDGESVVTVGASRIEDGQRVKITEPDRS